MVEKDVLPAGEERRAFLRYSVANYPKLTGSIDKNRKGTEQLVTFALGGCGFYGTEEVVSLRAGKRVTSVFNMEGVVSTPLEIQGNIIYATPVTIKDKKVIFYGIEFLEQFREQVRPIIDALEKEKAGKE